MTIDVRELGTVLGIWAHPDDEAYLSGGLMALAGDAGSRVVCVTATRGERGTPDPQRWPPDRLAAERTGELTRCLAVLGVTEHHWLGYADGGCAAIDESEPVATLSALIDEIRPDTVVTFGPDGNTGHADHRAVSRWATVAFGRSAPGGARLLHTATNESWVRRWKDVNERYDVFEPGFPVVTPDVRLDLALILDGPDLDRKVRALAAQTTQTAGLIGAMGADYAGWVADEAFLRAA